MASATEMTMTAEEFATRDDLPEFCELVRGKVVEMNVPGSRHGQVCFRFARLLAGHVEKEDLGHVLTNDSGVRTRRDPDTVRGADVAYYSFERLPRGPLPAGYPDIAPELVAEVISPSDRWPGVMAKVAEYLEAGVSVVLVLDPDAATIRLFDIRGGISLLDNSQQLSLPEHLPGFSAAVAEIFG